MKYLGIDFGTKRVGTAVSDTDGTLARPLSVLKNDSSLFDALDTVIAKEGIECIVIGNSAGNPVQRDIDEFVGQITLTSMLPVEMMTEAFTSAEAHGRKGKEVTSARATKAPTKPADLDARAAAVILQRYLDTNSKKKKK
jgi:putative Holliday junction resolvase